MADSIAIERSGDLIWGTVSRTFPPTGDNVAVLMSHDDESASNDWPSRYQQIEHIWGTLTAELDATLPGGLDKSELYRIDFRPAREESAAILHFKTTADIYDWYVRLDTAWQIELIAPKD